MYRKDLIESEIQKLAQALARILSLKREGKIEEAHTAARETLITDFAFDPDFLDTVSVDSFNQALLERNYPEAMLSVLADLLFESAHPFEDIPEINNRLHLVLAVFNRLEEEYHVQSLNNIAKREMIDKFLNLGQYE